MYELKKKFSKGDTITIGCKGRKSRTIDLTNPSQADLKKMFELGVDYVQKKK